MDIQRSPFSINIVESLVAITTIVVTWFGLHAVLWSWQPWPVDYAANEQLPDWFLIGRDELYKEFRVSVPLIMAISAIFLVRSLSRQDVRFFSFWSNISLAWPLILFPLVTIFSFLSLYCFPVGLILSFISIGKSFKSRAWLGSILAISWNIFCMIIAFNYFAGMWDLFGD